jgi:hypothetical protein
MDELDLNAHSVGFAFSTRESAGIVGPMMRTGDCMNWWRCTVRKHG